MSKLETIYKAWNGKKMLEVSFSRTGLIRTENRYSVKLPHFVFSISEDGEAKHFMIGAERILFLCKLIEARIDLEADKVRIAYIEERKKYEEKQSKEKKQKPEVEEIRFIP